MTREKAAAELLARRRARNSLHDYIKYTCKKYNTSVFSDRVCARLDQFVIDMQNGKRPILVFQAPPQHGKSEIVSRRLPAYLLGRFPDWRIGTASYSSDLIQLMSQDVRRNLDSPEHKRIFSNSSIARGKFDLNRIGEFNAPGGSGGYIGVGIGQGLTGRPVDIGII